MVRILLILMISITSSACERDGEKHNQNPIRIENSSNVIDIRGITHTSYSHEGKVTQRIAADQFLVRPRQFGGLRVKSINEAYLVNTSIDLHKRPDSDANTEEDLANTSTSSGSGVNLSSVIQNLAQARGVGRLTRVIITDLELNIFLNGNLRYKMLSNKAVIDFNKGQSSFNGFEYFHQDDVFLIRASEAYHDHGNNRFVIPGAFSFSSRTINRHGEGLIINDKGSLTFLDSE
ncbi:hypothetical protein [Geoalkalibacter subterraneus]|uniref:Uncharacterized protein n=1 Tax=Geoalkalibacter subterraneus TaxID=483547 RepID=A0A0B5FTI5_9BACT|nr:hypothetical protein [Geoalkalibacter subterraneus]AJF07480.1 hypothetical protein GSUB_14245 [Geoalkalibacter subterraneus]